MKYILIGGSGFIGNHFFKKINDDIIQNLDIDEGINQVNFTKCNILNPNDLNKIDLSNYDNITVIHLAAVHFDFQKYFYETNVEGTKNVLNFISSNVQIKKYVFFSSVATYGNSKYGKDENSIQLPNNDYGKSKLEAENLIKLWHKKNQRLQVIIVRPAVVFGEYNFGNVYNLIKQIKSGVFALIGDGKNIKSIAYAGNLVDSVLFCLKNIDAKQFIYNYCDYPQQNIKSQSIIISKLMNKVKPIKIPLWFTKIFTFPVDLIEKLIGKDLKINSMRVRKFTTSTFFMSDKIRKYGFIQSVSITKSYRSTVNWISKKEIPELRKKWYDKASKL
ncbi:NAD(P)-dependent oxidoreductase [Flavobacteriaceae bacterium]|nr:NAD(P)-dependent oxidoreductase [Flavobacteriaceae bacterium]